MVSSRDDAPQPPDANDAVAAGAHEPRDVMDATDVTDATGRSDAPGPAGPSASAGTADVEPEPPPEPPPDLSGRFHVMDTLRKLARPRLSGTHGARLVAEGVRRRFDELGYEVRAHAFQYSAAPGRFALPAAGVVFAVCALVATSLIVLGYAVAAAVVLGVGGVVVASIALLALPMIARLPWGRVAGENVLAMPAGKRPRYLIMAHMDSKSQLVPLSLRAPAMMLAALAWLALLGLALASLVQPLGATAVLAAGGVAVLAGIVLALSWADNKSPGALDNASGLTALLGLAELERNNGDIGFLVTDAEELGLAGARAIAGDLPTVFGVINLDGLDDDGEFQVIERFGWRRRGLAPHIAAALLGAAAERDMPANRRDLPHGVLVDHIPIVEAGLPALTIMRGSMRSLGRVHRPGDTVDRMRGTGIERTIELVSAALATLRTQQ